MSFVSTRTQIPLQRVAFHLGVDFWHFFQQDWVDHPITTDCDDDTYQYDWQSSGKLSRESMAQALRQAEDTVTNHLRYMFLPQWLEEDHLLPDYYRTELHSYYNARHQSKSINTKFGYVTEVGRKVSTLINTPAIVWQDVDGDGFTETAQVTVATTVTNTDEIKVYYPGKSGDDTFEIRPLTSVTIAGGNAIITFPRYLVALQELLEAPIGQDPHIIINALDDANYLAEVDVYRVYTDTTEQGLFYYEDDQNCTSVPCSLASDAACFTVRDDRLGILAYRRADYSGGVWAAAEYAGIPSKLRVYYRSGWRDPFNPSTTKTDGSLERMVVFYALSLLDTKLSGCDNTRNIWQYMTKDMAQSIGDERFTLSWNALDNPLGTTRVALQLWKYIQPRRLQGFSVAY